MSRPSLHGPLFDARLRQESALQRISSNAIARPVVELDAAAIRRLEAQVAAEAPFRLTTSIQATARRAWASVPASAQVTCEAGVIAAAGLFSVAGALVGNSFPDRDISVLGIGSHRFWAFHSAAAAWALREFVGAMQAMSTEGERPPAATRIAAMAAAGGAAGIGFHLVKDGAFGLLDGQKSVVFGIPGLLAADTAISGTFIDDDAWLLGNSFYCFKIARDLAVFAFGPEMATARAWALDTFRDQPTTRGDTT